MLKADIAKKSAFANLVARTVQVASARGAALTVPWTLKQLCDKLSELDGWTTEGIFRKPGSSSRMEKAKQQLKDGKALSDDVQVHDVACLIKAFFREQSEGILFLNKSIALQVHTMRKNKAKEREILLVQRAGLILLQRPSIDLVTYFFHMFDEQSKFDEEKTKMSLRNLAIVFSPNLFHAHKKDEIATTEEREAQLEFVLKLLERPYLGESKPTDVMTTAEKIPAEDVEKKYAKLVPSRKRSMTAEKVMKLGGTISKATKQMTAGTKRPAEDGDGERRSFFKRGNSIKRIRKASERGTFTNIAMAQQPRHPAINSAHVAPIVRDATASGAHASSSSSFSSSSRRPSGPGPTRVLGVNAGVTRMPRSSMSRAHGAGKVSMTVEGPAAHGPRRQSMGKVQKRPSTSDPLETNKKVLAEVTQVYSTSGRHSQRGKSFKAEVSEMRRPLGQWNTAAEATDAARVYV